MMHEATLLIAQQHAGLIAVAGVVVILVLLAA